MSQIVEKLKQIQADSAVFYIKLHNYHWNVKGMDFHPVHSALEAMYDEVTEQMDEVAERVLQIGEKPYVTLEDGSKEKVYPPYKIEIEMIRNKFFYNDLIDRVREEYK